MGAANVLVLSVGTGNMEELRATLLTPLIKSIRKGQCSQVLLLPSQLTRGNAEVLRREIQDLPITVRALPAPGQEDDPDACFAHFDTELEKLRENGVPPEQIVVDFTRGTKAMSAALVLAALRHGLPLLRYIHGTRDKHGLVVPGTEIVGEFSTTKVYAQQRIDQARQFLLEGLCAAALKLLTLPPKNNIPLRNLTEFYSAWDRLDYQYAAEFVEVPSKDALPRAWAGLLPSRAAIAWVEILGRPVPLDLAARADHLVKLVIDLLANAERRLDDGHLQDANLRCYRLLDLMAHIRLLRRGTNPRSERTTLHDMIDQLRSGKDPLAHELTTLERKGEIKARDRNESILVHGFRAISGHKVAELRAYLRKVEDLMHNKYLAGTAAKEWLSLARQARPTE